MRIYQHDLAPDLEITLTDSGIPLDLTAAVGIRVIGVLRGEVLFDRSLTGTSLGVVTMQWQPGDTAATGDVSVEVEVTWPGGKPQTFRPSSRVKITADFA